MLYVICEYICILEGDLTADRLKIKSIGFAVSKESSQAKFKHMGRNHFI